MREAGDIKGLRREYSERLGIYRARRRQAFDIHRRMHRVADKSLAGRHEIQKFRLSSLQEKAKAIR